MAITHNDLTRKARRSADLGSRLALFLVILSVICGLISFVLCLSAEATRSEASRYMLSNQGDGSRSYECTYSSNGKTPLACAVCAFLLLAVAMFAEHAYMLVAVASPRPLALVAWPAQNEHGTPSSSSSTKNLTKQTCFLFLTTWICFAIAEIILIIGIGVESGHMSQWWKPRPGCHVMRPGAYAAAGIFGLITVLLGVGLYITALQTQKLHQQEYIRQGMPPHGAGQHQYPPSAPSEPHDATQAAVPPNNKTSTSV